MLLSDVDIRAAVEQGRIKVDPYETSQIATIGYDLRVGDIAYIVNRRKKINIKDEGGISLYPGDIANIYTLEDIELDRTVGGLIVSSTRVSFRGLSHISTMVDAGWSGNLILGIHSYSTGAPVTLAYKSKIATLCFFETKSRTEVSVNRPKSRGDIAVQLDKLIETVGTNPQPAILPGEAEAITKQMLQLFTTLTQLLEKASSKDEA